jgi:hypothetical protein
LVINILKTFLDISKINPWVNIASKIFNVIKEYYTTGNEEERPELMLACITDLKKGKFCTGYYVLLDKDNFSEKEKEDFSVKNNYLMKDGKKYEDTDYLLFKLQKTPHRNDYSTFDWFRKLDNLNREFDRLKKESLIVSLKGIRTLILYSYDLTRYESNLFYFIINKIIKHIKDNDIKVAQRLLMRFLGNPYAPRESFDVDIQNFAFIQDLCNFPKVSESVSPIETFNSIHKIFTKTKEIIPMIERIDKVTVGDSNIPLIEAKKLQEIPIEGKKKIFEEGLNFVLNYLIRGVEPNKEDLIGNIISANKVHNSMLINKSIAKLVIDKISENNELTYNRKYGAWRINI